MRIPLRFPQLASAVFCLCVATAAPLRAQKVERWINSGFSCEYNLDLTQFNNEANYPTALQNIDVVQMFLNDVYNKGSDNPTFAARLALYRKFGIRVAVEGDPALNPPWTVDQNGNEYAYCQTVTCNAGASTGTVGSPDDVAKASAWKMLEKIKPVYDAGGEVSYLALGGFGMARILDNTNPNGEGPRNGCRFSEDVAEATLGSFMKYIHEGVTHHGVTLRGHPEIKMGLILAMPNIGYNGEPAYNPYVDDTPSAGGTHFEDVLQRIVNKVQEYGETLWFLHLDGGYENSIGHWPRMAAIRSQCVDPYHAKYLRLRFGVMLFANQTGHGPDYTTYCSESHATDDATYCSKVLDYVRDVKQNVGELDNYLVETYWAPSRDFPESTPDTFMNLITRLADPGNPSFWGYDHGYFRRTDRDIFDWRFYLSSDSQIAAWVDQNFGNQKRFGAEYHWLNYGVPQGLRGAWMFSAPAYVNKYPQVGPTSWEGAIDHFFRWGRTYDRRSARQSTISAGLMHSLVQRQFNAPTAAGNGGSGQLGNWGTSNSSVPVQVAAGFQTSDVAAGYYDSLAVSTDGTVYAWGSNTYGQLGNNTAGGQANAPNAVPSFGPVITQSDDGKKIISSNWGVNAAVDNTGREESGQFTKGQAWMWGINYDGQLGDGTTSPHYSPQLVLSAPGTPLTNVISIAAGSSHTSALMRDGTVKSWGTNGNGALGNPGAGSRSLYPVTVITNTGEPLNDVVQLACGGSRFCVAVRNDGTVWGWGANGTGQLGTGDTTDRYYATQIPNFSSIDRIAAGQYHVVAHSWGDRRVYAWGYNGYGQLGRSGAPITQTSPFPMDAGPDNMTEITDVAAGGYFSLMIRGRDEKVFVVGDNQSGQLGVGNTSALSVPKLSLF
jgi:alpha-tubulin suppressor-like RCC1 family protein